ncbi:MAG: HAMP domain-containing histidine kinase [Spirochaetes bacterium]|nr:HAMP domain-containing histidine kinase [Spirochaetota bacterium]
MLGLKLKETSISRIIGDSLAGIIKPDNVEISILSNINDEHLWIDHNKIVNALINLEKNALEAMPDGGCLTITIDDNIDTIFITIHDTGTGISDDNMEQLFTPFFTTKSPGEGTGLGLAETYGIIKAHSGSISIETNSDPLKGAPGTKAVIRIPRRLIRTDDPSKVIIHDDE